MDGPTAGHPSLEATCWAGPTATLVFETLSVVEAFADLFWPKRRMHQLGHQSDEQVAHLHLSAGGY